jgi:hypothetical protein
MDIVMKVTKSKTPKAVELVTDLLRQVLSEDEAKCVASIERVFPDVAAGRRAGILVVSLDDRMPSRSVDKVLDSLRRCEGVEYAQPAAPRKPHAAGTRRS